MPIQFNPNGIVTQNITEIIEERENDLKPTLGEDFAIDASSPIGSLLLADCNSELTVQELIAWMIPNMIDVQKAEGYFLECICAKNRIYRRQPEYTTVDLVLVGDPNLTILAGDVVVTDTIKDVIYNLKEDVTIGSDGMGIGKFICDYTGPFYPLSTSVFEIQTPVFGLNSVTIDFDNCNLAVGRDAETDAELRRRHNLSVEQTSTSTAESIKANIYSLNGVKHVRYFENFTESTDANGVPMKSFEYIVDGGDGDEITDIIFVNKPIGTHPYGSVTKTKKDSEGNTYQISYTPATQINLGLIVDIDTNGLPSQAWKNTVKQALKDELDRIQNIGAVVKSYNYYAVLTQFSEITNVNSIGFYNKDTETPQQAVPTYDLNNVRGIPRIEVEDISINISQN